MDFSKEHTLRTKGFNSIAGVDEAGAGPLAGPVVVAAVILPESFPAHVLNDSKKLTEKRRRELDTLIRDEALAFSIVVGSVKQINTDGIRPTNLWACKEAVKNLGNAEYVLMDAWTLPDLDLPQEGIVKGDATVASIAAASILAKVHRDTYMHTLDETFPHYGFAKHKGYGTKAHMEAIRTHGPCLEHRVSWEIFKKLV